MNTIINLGETKAVKAVPKSALGAAVGVNNPIWDYDDLVVTVSGDPLLVHVTAAVPGNDQQLRFYAEAVAAGGGNPAINVAGTLLVNVPDASALRLRHQELDENQVWVDSATQGDVALLANLAGSPNHRLLAEAVDSQGVVVPGATGYAWEVLTAGVVSTVPSSNTITLKGLAPGATLVRCTATNGSGGTIAGERNVWVYGAVVVEFQALAFQILPTSE